MTLEIVGGHILRRRQIPRVDSNGLRNGERRGKIDCPADDFVGKGNHSSVWRVGERFTQRDMAVVSNDVVERRHEKLICQFGVGGRATVSCRAFPRNGVRGRYRDYLTRKLPARVCNDRFQTLADEVAVPNVVLGRRGVEERLRVVVVDAIPCVGRRRVGRDSNADDAA